MATNALMVCTRAWEHGDAEEKLRKRTFLSRYVRVSIFRSFVLGDARARGHDLRSRHGGLSAPVRVTVRRGSIAQDGFNRLGDVDLKGPIAITFIDQFGQEE